MLALAKGPHIHRKKKTNKKINKQTNKQTSKKDERACACPLGSLLGLDL